MLDVRICDFVGDVEGVCETDAELVNEGVVVALDVIIAEVVQVWLRLCD